MRMYNINKYCIIEYYLKQNTISHTSLVHGRSAVLVKFSRQLCRARDYRASSNFCHSDMYMYLPSSCESSAECAATHGLLDERIHARMATLVQFMKTGVALRHQATQLLKLFVFHYTAFLVYATEREHSAGLCTVKAAVQLIETNLPAAI